MRKPVPKLTFFQWLLSRVTYQPRLVTYLAFMLAVMIGLLISSFAFATTTPVVAGSASPGVVVSASPASLRSAYAMCSSTCYLMVFNAVAVPANGATTAGAPNVSGAMVHCIGPSTSIVPSLNFNHEDLEWFSVGIAIAISSTGCGTLTQSSVGFIHAVSQ